jgi:hypothetical protein
MDLPVVIHAVLADQQVTCQKEDEDGERENAQSRGMQNRILLLARRKSATALTLTLSRYLW